MHSLKASALFVLVLASLAACTNSFQAAPVASSQAYEQHQMNLRMSPDDQGSHERGW